MPIIQPRYVSPGLVRPDGSVEGPLGNLLRSLVSAANSAPSSINVADLQARVTTLENGGPSWNGQGLNGITVSGNSGSGYIFTLTATTTNIPEGVNLYFTDARARAAVVVDSIADSDTTHAPSRNAVFDALAGKETAGAAASAQAAAQAYADALVAGLSWKQAVRAATTVAGTLASSFENGDTIDGVVLATGDRILVKNQAAPAENGIYTVNASGAPTRALDANSGAELVNASCYVSEGTTLADTQWTCTTNSPITPGSTSLAFAQLSTGGATPTGTGFRHVTAGVEDGASVTIDGISAASGGDVKVIAPATHAASSKSTPVDNDEFTGTDSASSYGLVRFTWANIKAGFWSALGALIAAGTGKTTPVNADSFAICDSAASNATKQVTFTNFKAFLKTYFDTVYTAGSFAITAWSNATTTITAVTTNPTKGTIVRDKIYWRRVGDSMEVRIDYEHSAAGSAGSGMYLFTIPDGKTIDTTKVSATTGSSSSIFVGTGVVSDLATYTYVVFVTPYNTTKVRISDTVAGPVGSANRPMSATKWALGMTFVVPIVEWA